MIAKLTLPGGHLLELAKEWEENKLQLFLYSDAAGSQVHPQKYFHVLVFAKVGAPGEKILCTFSGDCEHPNMNQRPTNVLSQGFFSRRSGRVLGSVTLQEKSEVADYFERNLLSSSLSYNF